MSRDSTHQSFHDTLYDSESSSEASEEEEQQERRPVSLSHNSMVQTFAGYLSKEIGNRQAWFVVVGTYLDYTCKLDLEQV